MQKKDFTLNEAVRANLLVNKRPLKSRPFWNKVYGQTDGQRDRGWTNRKTDGQGRESN